MPTGPKSRTASYGFVRLILVRPFVDEVLRRGVDPEPVLARAGLVSAALEDPDRFVHAETMYGLFNGLAEAAGDPHLGYHVGSKLEFADWPPFHRAVRVAKTVGEFMTEFIAAVPSEANSVRHELTIGSSGACYRVHRLIETANSPQHTEAFGIAHFIRLFQAISGATWHPENALIRTQYTDAVPKRVQGVQVVKKASGGLELHFPLSWLQAPIEIRSAFTSADAAARPGLAQDVSLIAVFHASARTLLHDLNAGLDEVAQTVGLEGTALQAALKNEGTSAAKEFRRLRLETAKARLRANDGSVSEIAGDLGYTDPAHFTRFFKTQTGQSPRAFRKAANTGKN